MHGIIIIEKNNCYFKEVDRAYLEQFLKTNFCSFFVLTQKKKIYLTVFKNYVPQKTKNRKQDLEVFSCFVKSTKKIRN